MLSKAPFISARNYTRATRLVVQAVCIHTMEAPEGPKTAENVANWFANQPANGTMIDGKRFAGTSAHWNVDNDSVVQSVREQDVAWHAGPVNNWSIGVEHAGYAKQSVPEWLDDYSMAMLVRSSQLMAEICRRWDIPVARLTADDLRKGKRNGIFGHSDVTDGLTGGLGHRDPGEHFPWQMYLTMVAEKLDLLVTADSNVSGLVTASILNVRSAPSSQSALIASLYQGTHVTIREYEQAATPGAPNGWYKIQLADGRLGYVSAAYIAKT
jgi:N-acetyl-anhydromuramyl-L-alanine amidase AmpD